MGGPRKGPRRGKTVSSLLVVFHSFRVNLEDIGVFLDDDDLRCEEERFHDGINPFNTLVFDDASHERTSAYG